MAVDISRWRGSREKRIPVLLLANDREIMGELANGLRANLAGGAIIIGISIVGALYAVMLIVQQFSGK